jgi:hypothetical protein
LFTLEKKLIIVFTVVSMGLAWSLASNTGVKHVDITDRVKEGILDVARRYKKIKSSVIPYDTWYLISDGAEARM